jgi:hypothetical protein
MPSCHLAAFYTASGAALTTETELTCVADSILTPVSTSRFAVPADIPYVRWLAAESATLLSARLRTPTLDVKRMTRRIIPINKGGLVWPLTMAVYDANFMPLPLTPTEDFEILVTNGAAEHVYGLCELGPATLEPIPAGDIRAVRLTGATTVTASAWSLCTMTPDSSLEPAQYTMIGFIPYSVSGVAARAVITGSTYREGMPCIAAATESAAMTCERSIFTDLMTHSIGTFNHLNIPQFEFLCNAADTAQVVYAYLVKTGPATGMASTATAPMTGATL